MLEDRITELLSKVTELEVEVANSRSNTSGLRTFPRPSMRVRSMPL